MDINESNEIIRNTIKNNILTDIFLLKSIDEFGCFKYFIHLDEKHIIFSFSTSDFEKIYNFSGKDYINKEFSEFSHMINVKHIDIMYSLSIFIDFSKYKSLPKDKLEEFAVKTSEKFASFRTNLYGSVIKKYISEISTKKVSDPIGLSLANRNKIYFLPTSEKLVVLHGINFEAKTDNHLAKLFFREIDDAKLGGGSSVDVKFYFNTIPEFISSIEKDVSKFQAGFVGFCKSLIYNIIIYIISCIYTINQSHVLTILYLIYQ